MNRSESIKNLAAGLAKFNSEVSSISKDAKNPFFKSDYVTLDKLIMATRDILQKNGLSVLQMPLSREIPTANGNMILEIGIQTILLHESGEYIESEPLFMTPAKQDPQGAGSIISYMRRYSYQAVLNLNTGQDDDGNYMSNKTINPDEYEKYQGNNSNKSNSYNTNKTGSITEKQISRIWGIAKENNINKEVVFNLIKSYGVTDAKFLTKDKYDDLCTKLETGEIPATQQQFDSIKTLMSLKGVSKAEMPNILTTVLGLKKPSNELTSNEAIMVINHLTSLEVIA